MTNLNNKGDKTKINEDGSLESHFLISAKEMQDKLNEVSPSLCLAKWKQVSLHLTTGHTNSCYHPPLHQIDANAIAKNPSMLHNTVQKIQARTEMLNGQRPNECSYCWNVEDNGDLSDRSYRSGEPWAAKDFNNIINDDVSNVTPSYVEVNFNSNCNLSCSYCSPQFSTSWMKEVKEYPEGYPTSVAHNKLEFFQGDRKPLLNSDNNPYVDAFWKWWPDLYPELQHFRMTGGEPLMDKNTYKVFDYVLANPKPDLHLNVTSNFSVEPKLFDKYMGYVTRLCDVEQDNIEHFMQYVSVDSYGPQAEYMRHGLDFQLLLKNVNTFLTDAPGKNSVTFIITMNMLSIPNLKDLLMEILALRAKYNKTYQRIWFDTPLLREPKWQCVQLAPTSLKQKLNSVYEWMKTHQETELTRFQGFKDYEIQRIERDINFMNVGNFSRQETNQRKADFYRFFNEHDNRRNTDFISVFPELQSFWDQCKQEAQKK